LGIDIIVTSDQLADVAFGAPDYVPGQFFVELIKVAFLDI
jgi:hypothetical protein